MPPQTPTPPAADARVRAAGFRSGFVTLIGRPNAGKSTLMNALVGRKVAIVTPHPQTTRTHLVGVFNLPASAGFAGAQIAFVDTPGVHRGKSNLHREMMRSVHEGLDGRDLALLLVDATRVYGAEDALALSLLDARATRPAAGPAEAPRGGAAPGDVPPVVLALNKVDQIRDRRGLLPLIDAWKGRYPFAEIVPISALAGDNLPALVQSLLAYLPLGPEYFPLAQHTDQPERFWISEVIREQAMLLTREEVPHALAVRIERDETKRSLRVLAAAIVCERPGQKAILVGRGGEMIRRIGTQARQQLETALKVKIFLELHVLVRPEWRENSRWLDAVDWRKGGER